MESLPRPHYLLISESSHLLGPGRWRFILRLAGGEERMVADDIDPEARGDRLELLTVVRGLEALEQPSRVTLWTPSVYVREGIRHGLREWRENGWMWEYFGRMVPVKNDDLWKRLDRAMEFHEVDCRTWRIDAAHNPKGEVRQQEAVSPGAERELDSQEVSRTALIRGKLRQWKSTVGECLNEVREGTRLAEN
ncbi:MAG: RNase H family protein [Thermoguttaceae bacterium]